MSCSLGRSAEWCTGSFAIRRARSSVRSACGRAAAWQAHASCLAAALAASCTSCTNLLLARYRDDVLLAQHTYKLGQEYLEVGDLTVCYQEAGTGDPVVMMSRRRSPRRAQRCGKLPDGRTFADRSRAAIDRLQPACPLGAAGRARASLPDPGSGTLRPVVEGACRQNRRPSHCGQSGRGGGQELARGDQF